MALELPFGTRVKNPEPADLYYLNLSKVPYTDAAQILAQVPMSVRYEGMSFYVAGGTEYQFRGGIGDEHLVKKTVEIAIGNLDGQSKSGNGIVYTGSTLYMQTADQNNPGLVSTGAQTFAGSKTFAGNATFNGWVTLNSRVPIGTNSFFLADATNGFRVHNSDNTEVRFKVHNSGQTDIGGPLNVTASIGTYGTFDHSVSGAAYLNLRYNGSLYGYIGQASGLVSGGLDTDLAIRSEGRIDLAVGTARQMRITLGSVSIGNTNFYTASSGVAFVNDGGSAYGRIGRVTIGKSGTGFGVIGDGFNTTTTNNVYEYNSNSTAAQIDFTSGNIAFKTAPSGTSGNTVTFTTRMLINNSTGQVDVSGNIRASTSETNGAQFRYGGSYLYGIGNLGNSYNDVFYHHSGSGIRLGYYDGSTFSPQATLLRSGSFGIGTTDPKSRMHIVVPTHTNQMTLGSASGTGLAVTSTSAAYGLFFGVASNGNAWMQVGRNDSNTNYYNLNLQPSGGSVSIGYNAEQALSAKFQVNGLGMASDWTATSDQRIKRNIQRVDYSVSKILAISQLVSEYDRIDTGKHEIGFIAQELLEIAPEYVVAPENKEALMSVNYSKMVAPLYKGYAFVMDELTTLRNRVKELESKLNQ